METIYDIEVTNSQGEPVSIADFQGQVLLIVNTASKCGFTPQFKELQSLYEKYKEQGFTILGFPSDEFMNQEFEEQEKIIEFCQVNYGVTFPMFQKTHVKGKNIHPLFRYLTAQQSGLLTGTIKWNFTKFLVSREGEVVQRYAPKTSPLKIEKDLQELL
ncbi:glutathione peroxidase [Bacillus badius]|uniref:Glutathione peroxidase n=1 Tax=Bacillus badius TaxID=1455 RepID=A0ABR5ANR5_BACBA|nr:glutathione peroxidase [Bacillus badius]KIL71872.1 Glutathione peroxidase family protein [Bacillus badius]KIL72683.1 Glutathione peroxidase family protein [Bacillus badius]KZR57930.1 glutathione peroxidase [Bacillus badius]MED4718423.1 glutathione peroxidase [Bacillus badius]